MNSLRLQNFKDEALELSNNSCCNFQHGCVIVRKGEILARGFNDENCHAEQNAISALERLLCSRCEKEV